MADRHFKRDPSYRLHKQSGQGIVTLTDGLGNRRDILLGPYGTKASREEYRRVLAEWEAAGRTLPKPKGETDLTISELILAFWPHAERHYRHPDGRPTSELADFRLSLKPLKRLYGNTAARDFGPLALKAVRQAMVTGSWLTPAEKAERQANGNKETCCRGVANQRTGRIRRMFRWGVENELVPAPVLQALLAVRGLPKGRSEARETEPVRPVLPAVVEATLPAVRPQVAAMIRLQEHTGMRPGEVTILRGIDLDTSGKVWVYRPGSDQGAAGRHKTAWRGHQRVILLGPKAQEVLRPWLRLNLTEYLFAPREAEAQRDAARSAARTTPLTPSQRKRRPKAKPKRPPGDHYSVMSYARAIARAVRLLNRKAVEEGRPTIPHWHPHQLRHLKATELRREAGLDAARVVLGHRSPTITEHYAELDVNQAAAMMERLG